MGLEGLTYLGNHGYELLEPGAHEPEIDGAAASRAGLPAAFLAKLDGAELARLGLRSEDKGPIQALHWRGAPDEGAAEARARELAAVAQAGGLVPRWGRKVLELRPIAGIDKGTAVHRLLLAHAPLAAALYAGDDRTDLDAFTALREAVEAGTLRSAVCIGVVSDETPQELADGADVLVDGTAGVRRTLELLADA